MRVTSVFKRLLDLSGITVTDVQFSADAVVVDVWLRSRRLRCPRCEFTTKAQYDTRAVPSTWRHLDLAARRLRIRADLRRLCCPVHGVITEGVPFAPPGSRFTRDFEDLVGWLATTMDKTALARLVRVDWDTTGRIIERVVADRLDPDRLQHLFQVGVDEVSWRKGHSYLTLVSNHETGKFVWGREGKDAATLDHFFDDLGADRAETIQAVSMDMSPAFRKSVSTHAGQAVICYDPFHVVALATAALDKVRRQVWQELRKLPDQDTARRFRGARWALMKNPSAPRGARSYSRCSRERLEEISLGPMTYLDAERRRGQQHVRKLVTVSRYRNGAPGDPRDKAKAGLLESQFPAMQLDFRRKIPDTDAASCPGIVGGRGNLRERGDAQ